MLNEVSTEELLKEIQRRKGAEVAEIRAKIEEHKAAIRTLEAQIAARNGEKAAKSAKVKGASGSDIPAADRAVKVFAALEGTSGLNISDLADKAGFDGVSLKKTLEELVAEKKIKREGKARGTKYVLA